MLLVYSVCSACGQNNLNFYVTYSVAGTDHATDWSFTYRNIMKSESLTEVLEYIQSQNNAIQHNNWAVLGFKV